MKESFYFGENGQELLGTYHAPPLITDRRYGILLCNPIGQEHIRSYRLYLRLAEQLAGEGFHVMRLDYFGTGDSAGDSNTGDPARWVDDIALAVEELHDAGDIDRVSLLGLRFGATLAALAGAARVNLDSLVLWEPVITGSRYLAELQDMQHSWLKRQLCYPAIQPTADERLREVLGFPVSEGLFKALTALDLLSLDTPPAPSVMLLVNEANAPTHSLEQHLNRLGATTSYQHVPEQQVWYKDGRLDSALVPTKSILAILNWYQENCP